MTKECLWYNGETGHYELLEFDPNGLTKNQIIKEVEKIFANIFPEWDNPDFSKEKVFETLYLIDVDDFKRVTELKD